MREDNIIMLQETLEIINRGSYSAGNTTVHLKLSKKDMMRSTVLLPDAVRAIEKEEKLNTIRGLGRCAYGCVNMDSFSDVIRLYDQYGYLLEMEEKPVLVLNFANPVNPGGGVRRGARAQEEDLCRKSSLLLSLESGEAKAYYDYNRSLNSFMGSDAMIFTPNVEIIRDDSGMLLEETLIVSVLTCAAPMITHGTEGMSEEAYRQMLFTRITGMLKCAAAFGYNVLVLGAWGCGAFGNDAAVMSDLFYRALKELDYCGMRESDLFRKIDFAVLDRTMDQYNYMQFKRNFTQENFYREEDQAEIDRVKKRIAETEQYLDKIRGSLIGGAAGDALGYAIEFWGEEEIFSHYGPDGIREYELDPVSGKAIISDDTQMTLFTANGILVGDTRFSMRGIGGQPMGYVPTSYLDWLFTQETTFEQREKGSSGRYSISWLLDVPELYSRRAPGNTCLSALYQQKDGKVHGNIEHPLNRSKGCGGVMRVAPMGLKCFPHTDMEMIDLEGANLAAVTHGHSLGYMPAAVLTHIIHRIVYAREKQSLKQIVLDARNTVAKIFSEDGHIGELTGIIDLAVLLSENKADDLENIHRLGEGWVGEEALAIAIYCALRYQDDFSAGIIAAVNHKGDSDSTGAITGNILGAWLGFERIDDRWKQNLELYDVIIEMADDLCHGCQMSEYSTYSNPNWESKYINMHWKKEMRDSFSEAVEQPTINKGSNDKLTISREEKDAVYFHLPDEPDGYLSNWFIAPFDLDGQHFTSVEQYIMYRKCMAFGDTASATAVLQTNDTAQQQFIGRQASGYIDSVWAGMRQMIVIQGLMAKFDQNEELKQKLLNTDDAILVECAGKDKIWACGIHLNDDRRRNADNWTGMNLLGFALMEVRDMLRLKDESCRRLL